ncbi:hypothetical protein ACFQ3Z_26535 [Streptomyces nogalater]
MTSHDESGLLPEVIVYQGEFVDDDEPQPHAGPAPAAAPAVRPGASPTRRPPPPASPPPAPCRVCATPGP